MRTNQLAEQVRKITDCERPCRELPDAWYSTSPEVAAEAVKLCGMCPVTEACRRAGESEEFGVWGGVVRHPLWRGASV